MNTQRPVVKRVRGKSCDHAFITVGGVAIRTIRPVTPHLNPENGRELTADCPYPRHQ